MFQQLWHACLLVGAIVYGSFVMIGDGPCEKSLNAASPIALATKIATFPHFWSDAQRSSIQSGGDSAQTWFAGVVKDTFYEKTLTCNNKFQKGAPNPTMPTQINVDPNAPKIIPEPSVNPAGLPEIPKDLK